MGTSTIGEQVIEYYCPPYDFDCKHKKECPHLMGLSTHWVFSQYSRARDQYREFLEIRDRFQHRLDDAYKRIRNLEKENNELKAKLETIHSKRSNPTKSQRRRSREKSIEAHPKVILGGFARNLEGLTIL